MKRKIIFATNNKHKLSEIRSILGELFDIVSLSDLEIFEDIPETADSLDGNALQKAEFVHQKTGLDCFADDTGLEVEALNGAPGVYSARYAGEEATFDDNMNKMLLELEGQTERSARFRTVIALILDKKKYYFEGAVEGKILTQKKGGEGFGYDPIFQPTGYEESFAEMDSEEKNRISHRGLAVKKLSSFLLSKTD